MPYKNPEDTIKYREENKEREKKDKQNIENQGNIKRPLQYQVGNTKVL